MSVPFTTINFPNVKAQEYSSYYDSKFSKNPTDDYKYECQKGPFEGFFVSSVEFCDIQMKEKPESPQEPPQTSSLTVYKEVFGCDNIFEDFDGRGLIMNCKELSNNSPLWINCEDAPMSFEVFCQNLPENLFDIRVSDSQNNPIANDFVGPEDGRTFDNLQPGTYTVEEIKHETSINQLGPKGDEALCKERGFTGGGLLDNQNAGLRYFICLEYEEEQGNDCNTITLVVGEQRTCTVKNYIHTTERIPEMMES